MSKTNLNPLTVAMAGTSRAPEADEARRAEALSYRIQGYTYRQIGKMLGLSHEAARNIIHRAINDLATSSAETAEEVRRIEIERLDMMVQKAMQIMDSSEDPKVVLAAMDRLMSLSSLRFDLFGLKGASAPPEMPITRAALTDGIRQGVK